MNRRFYFFAAVLFLSPVYMKAQALRDSVPISMEQIFDLALKNSEEHKLSERYADVAKQQVAISKLNRLPNIESGLTYGYISNSDIWTPHFSDHQKGEIPHHLTQLTLTAAEVVFQGGAVNNTILKSSLQEQIAALNVEKNAADIKFLVAARYLDIYKLINQKKIYENNTALAEKRLQNILALQRQGMVTQNDVLRTQLTISDYKLTTKKIVNSMEILNIQLNTVIGMPDTFRLLPDSNLLREPAVTKPRTDFIAAAYQHNHELKIAALENKVSATELKLIKSERMPQVSVFAGSALQRPYLNALPAIDIYFNVWQAGVNVRYNISSIYKTPKKIAAGKLLVEYTAQKETIIKQNMEVQVSSAYIKYEEAKDQLATLKSDLLSAEENYRVVEKKYFNQLSLLTDLIDAGNIKIEAELKVTSATIDVIYYYYQLLKYTGEI